VTARILVVDDIDSNVRLLEARLQAEYFDVRTASSGRAAIEATRNDRVDLVLLDVMMPDMTGFEVCSRLKADPRTANIPVIMVTSLDQAEHRVRGLECGADDFLTKPVSDTALVTRVKSLVRLKAVTDELELRAATMKAVGIDVSDLLKENPGLGGRILVVDDRDNSVTRIRQALRAPFEVEVTPDPNEALARAEAGDPDLFLVSLSLAAGDGLRLCTQLRTLDGLRQTPVVLITNADETPLLMRALDLGVNDYIIRPIDANELRARVRTQLRRKLYQERLRSTVTSAVELAIKDPLTGLHNRRYLDAHLDSELARAAQTGRPVCILAFDIDHFKGINDAHGHESGDDVLRDFADRLRKGVRGIDLVARYGGEEFLLVMPETDAAFAGAVAERLRSDVEKVPFVTRSGHAIPVTVSIGIAEWKGPSDTSEALLRRADLALYAAKRTGRNRVVASAA
jgi:two-component system cell cycle response regulator